MNIECRAACAPSVPLPTSAVTARSAISAAQEEKHGEDMNGPSFFRLLLVLPMCLALGSCSRTEVPTLAPPPMVVEQAPAPPMPVAFDTTHPFVDEQWAEQWQALDAQGLDKDQITSKMVNENWRTLLERLRKDGLTEDEFIVLFARLGAPSQDPMGRKVQELYTGKYLRKPKVSSPPDLSTKDTGITRPLYKGVVTDSNARRCRTFINTHSRWFEESEARYGVPTEVAAALLFVETRLGDYLGEQNAFITLASMSISRSPDAIPDWLAKLPGVENRLDWVGERMEDKANWAYTELRALLKYSLANGIDPFEMPSSVYGAIGLCQFMPSNIGVYAVDGNEDGIIDLFDPPDAVASLSNYLAKHGWKSTMTVPEKVKVLRRYNNLSVYANTILALAEKIKSIPGRPTVHREYVRPTHTEVSES